MDGKELGEGDRSREIRVVFARVRSKESKERYLKRREEMEKKAEKNPKPDKRNKAEGKREKRGRPSQITKSSVCLQPMQSDETVLNPKSTR